MQYKYDEKYINNALVISVLIAFFYTLITAILFTKSPEGSGLEGFLHFISEPFYLAHMFKAFITNTVLILISCISLLFWISKKQSN